MHKYEVKKEGRVICHYEDEKCRYSIEEIRNLKKAGYKLYVDGKQWKEPAKKSSQKGC